MAVQFTAFMALRKNDITTAPLVLFPRILFSKMIVRKLFVTKPKVEIQIGKQTHRNILFETDSCAGAGNMRAHRVQGGSQDHWKTECYVIVEKTKW